MPAVSVSDIAPGARVIIRDEEWLVRTNDPCDLGGRQLACIGISELVRDRDGIFLTAIDEVEVLDPARTELVQDDSPGFLQSLLYLEARLRQTVPTHNEVSMGHRGAMDTLPFQLQPTHRVLQQLRPRFLIADAVGLGKTLEAGVLVSELIHRGRGRRILVVTTKSMMQQFQKEFWTRFSIPLTRLDSAGIQRIRRQIPASHNPFHYYDRTIISVDTLKRDTEYRHYLETAHWDIIVIDEAHNVSYKGTRTLNNKLATLLSQRSDALILLTATPHSGQQESFASLMRMLDPTVLPRKADYTKEDIEHLFLRRFKRDVRDEIRQEFPERKVFRFRASPSPAEERAFETLAQLKLQSDATARGGDVLFRTTIEKALFSSPRACAQTVRERMRRLKARDSSHPDLPRLEQMARAVEAVGPDDFGKLGELVRLLTSDPTWKWSHTVAADRLVIFTERIETLNLLREELPKRLGLPANAVAILHGGVSDTEIAETVERFGQTQSPLRLLIASDMASEGLNLHFQSHRLVHFDIPWSLMVFQQRNGRVDRYGQKATPLIAYLSTDTAQQEIRGDARILEILVEKDEQAARNIGDPSIFMGLFDEEAETERVAKAIQSDESPEDFEDSLANLDDGLDWLDALMETDGAHPATNPSVNPRPPLSLFESDYEYVRQGFNELHRSDRFPDAPRTDDRHQTIEVRPDADLQRFLDLQLSSEMEPRDGIYTLSARVETVKESIRSARDSDRWPPVQYLWPVHPVARWLDYKLLSLVGRQKAPVIRVRKGLSPGDALVLVSAVIPNRRGQPVLNDWFAVRMAADGAVAGILTMEELIGSTGLGREEIPNALTPVDLLRLRGLLPKALAAARTRMTQLQQSFRQEMEDRTRVELGRLADLRFEHQQQLDLEFGAPGDAPAPAQRGRKEARMREIDSLFRQYENWVRDTLVIEPRPHLTVAAVLTA